MKEIEELQGEEYVNEKKYQEDIKSLTPSDILRALLDTFDKDTTVEMIEKNIIEAIMSLERIKIDRIQNIFNMKHSWDFIEEQKKKEELAEVKT